MPSRSSRAVIHGLLFPTFVSAGCAFAACGEDGVLGPVVDDGGQPDSAIPPVDAGVEPDAMTKADADAVVDGGPFARFVAVGDGITAGAAGYGIDPVSQAAAYPVRLAGGMDAGFIVPFLTDAGCPRSGAHPMTEGTCERTGTGPVQNLAVPRARLIDALDKRPSPSQVETLFLGSNTQVSALRSLAPSFVAVELGTEDVLTPSLRGTLGDPDAGLEPDLLSPSAFQSRYARLATEIGKVPSLQGVVLVGVIEPVKYIPHLLPGGYYFLTRDARGQVVGKPVNSNCSPITPLGTPNPLAANMVSFRIVYDASYPEINCDPAAYPNGDARRGAFLLDTQEQAVVRSRVDDYNAIIEEEAQARGWAFYDPNPLLETLRTQKSAEGRYTAMRKCQDLPSATTAPQFQNAVLVSCPVPDSGPTAPFAATPMFGSFFSLDAVHPTPDGQSLLAAGIAKAINAKYNMSLPTSY